MNELRTAVMATIFYYDSFDLPLSFAEVYKYLINPRRLSGIDKPIPEIKPAELLNELDMLARTGLIGRKNGFYFRPGREKLYARRIEKDKLAMRKWKKFLHLAEFIRLAPYLRAVFVSGSLATNNPELKSDFDVFVVIRSGRLYTGRFFLWIISSALGARRGRFDVVAPDKLCFNHYIADDSLELSHKSLFIAQSVANMKPVLFPEGFLENFSSANRWVNSYCYNFKTLGNYRTVRSNGLAVSFAAAIEFLMNNFLGDWAERTLKFLQQRRIRNNPATYESGGRIIFNDRELEFHPRSFEKTVIAEYNRSLVKIGALCLPETDSGLL